MVVVVDKDNSNGLTVFVDLHKANEGSDDLHGQFENLGAMLRSWIMLMNAVRFQADIDDIAYAAAVRMAMPIFMDNVKVCSMSMVIGRVNVKGSLGF